MNYDGNPEGYGIGKKPAVTYNTFGSTLSEEFLRVHVKKILNTTYTHMDSVVVERQVIGRLDSLRVGVVEQNSYTIYGQSE